MLNAVFRPVTEWPLKPTPANKRKRATFRAKYAQTLDLLESELNHLSARDVVIQAYFDGREIRNDGWPRNSTRPSQPGVILTFYVKSIAFSYPCDRFDEWEDNLRGIGLSLQALRAVDRYGVTHGSQQYEGFKRLEAPKNDNLAATSFLAEHAGLSTKQVENDPQSAYRLAAYKLHPDKGGSSELFTQLQRHYLRLTAAT